MTAAMIGGNRPDSFVAAMYQRTRTLHLEAERSGVLADILRGAASREGYVLLLRNLFAAYQQLEKGLAQHVRMPALARLGAYRLDRAGAIASDLSALCGPDWQQHVPLLPEGQSYADRLRTAAEADGSLLIAHAYTRYLGDLSGGQIVQRILANSIGLRPNQLSHYDFSNFADPASLKAAYRAALEYAGARVADPVAVIEESAVAFQHNIALSVAVKARITTQTFVTEQTSAAD